MSVDVNIHNVTQVRATPSTKCTTESGAVFYYTFLEFFTRDQVWPEVVRVFSATPLEIEQGEPNDRVCA